MFGSRLLPVALLIILLGSFFVLATKLYEAYRVIEKEEITEVRVQAVQDKLIDYYTLNGRYPCPASLTAALDTSQFGKEVSNCKMQQEGLIVASGFSHNPVASGFIPVRTLGLADETGFDGWGKRLAYSISTGFTAKNPDELEAISEIKVTDQHKTNVTSEEGNVIFSVVAFKDVDAGAHSTDGVLIAPCAGSESEEVCNFDYLVARNNQQGAEGSGANNTKISYHVGRKCNSSAPPARVGFLLDTSGSMGVTASCPPGREGPCNRMDLALWALHRTMHARSHQTKNQSDTFTGYTGFTDNTSIAGAENAIKDNFQMADDAVIEDEIFKACPSGMTPLGAHIGAVAKLVEEGSENVPNVITVISDGLSNQGQNPVDVAIFLKENAPHIRVNIVDVGNNPSLAEVAETTGGDYFQSSDPDALLEALYESIGICNSASVNFPDISNKRQCSK